ncbi:SEL1/TPR repeat protein, protein kinase inhibitor Nif1 [Schizosaccharomyces osmophilus]|uniref:SEL1/TPR repeat protein, protein kinase inhibitor Nif1 n=1 Tax=Schizosaccharomyces osmophilus TaxID=2545709 RepID=A0AAF0AV92_9SCHI|nr:SEL1/TPR repeat protein, protein kinase inhibitor Nif1 [Schizosaccharomyces osmophilus]WBW72168.1 SEL1/TPR repeat protein, protein kinase inhibitor Nif1 [Schizosaccharomyces osmophilus]
MSEVEQQLSSGGLSKIQSSPLSVDTKLDGESLDGSRRSGYHGLSPLDALARKHRDLTRQLNLHTYANSPISKSEDCLVLPKDKVPGISMHRTGSPLTPSESHSSMATHGPSVYDEDHYYVAKQLSSVFGTPDNDEDDDFEYSEKLYAESRLSSNSEYNDAVANHFDDDEYFKSLHPPNAPYRQQIDFLKPNDLALPASSPQRETNPSAPSANRPPVLRSSTSPTILGSSSPPVRSLESTLTVSHSSEALNSPETSAEFYNISNISNSSNVGDFSAIIRDQQNDAATTNQSSSSLDSPLGSQSRPAALHGAIQFTRSAPKHQTVSIFRTQSPFLKRADKERANLNKTMVSINKSINIYQSFAENKSHNVDLSNSFRLLPLSTRLEYPILRHLEFSLQALTMSAIQFVDENHVDIPYTNLKTDLSPFQNNLFKYENLSKEDHLHQAIRYHLSNDFNKGFLHSSFAARRDDHTASFIYGLYLRHGLACSPKTHVSFLFLLKTATFLLRELSISLQEATVNSDSTYTSELESKRYTTDRLLLALVLYELAVCFMHGWGITRDRPLGIHLIKLSGAWGDVDAQFEAGIQFSLGTVADKDSQMAANYFLLAESQGLLPPQKCKWIYKPKYNLPLNYNVPAAKEVTLVINILENIEVNTVKLNGKTKAKFRNFISAVRYL